MVTRAAQKTARQARQAVTRVTGGSIAQRKQPQPGRSVARAHGPAPSWPCPGPGLQGHHHEYKDRLDSHLSQIVEAPPALP